MKKAIIAALAVATIASCTKQESFEGATDTTTTQEIKFSSGIQSRVSGGKWELSDQIGIEAYFCINQIHENGANYVSWNDYYTSTPYRADNAGSWTTFTVESGHSALFFPSFDLTEAYEYYDEIEAYLEIYAFYPYSIYDEQQGYYKLDISDQSDLDALDVLLGDGSAYGDSSSVELDFYHNMASVKFNIEAESSISSLEGLEFEIENVAVVSDPTYILDWSTYPTEYGTIEGVVDVADDGLSASVDMILFPTAYYSGDGFGYTPSPITVTLKATLNGEALYANLTTNFYAEMQQSFSLVIGKDTIEVGQATIEEWGEIDEATDLTLNEYDGEMTIAEFIEMGLTNIPVSNKWVITGDATDRQLEMMTNSLVSSTDGGINNNGRTISVTFTDLTTIPDNLFKSCTALKSISAPEVLSVGDDAFIYCTELQSVSMPKLTTAGECAFQDCQSLKSVEFEQLTSVGDNTFHNCYALSTVSLPRLESAGQWAFGDCIVLEQISLPSLGAISDYMFSFCYILQDVSIPKATSIGEYGFMSCFDLESITLEAVESIGVTAFLSCTSLIEAHFPAVTTVADAAFVNCSLITTLSFATNSGVKLTSVYEGIFGPPFNYNVTLTVGAANAEYVTCDVEPHGTLCDVLTVDGCVSEFKEIIVLDE
ncbi:MAG: leucine-rich repeat protein [Rikenellaceae bacterium]